jgi:predicted phosphodiesterase
VLPLEAVIPEKTTSIHTAGKLVFHSVGDTGGINGTDVQELIAAAMEKQFDPANEADNPAFFYHLGDVVYYSGMSRHYPEQFYDPYKYYPAPIFAIPGNHDGDTHTRPGDEPDPEPTLFGFMSNFCDSQRHHYNAYRDTMTQPYVYWALDAPFAIFIGLYGNIDGMLDGTGTVEQETWLTEQLAAIKALESAPSDGGPSNDGFVIVAVHQPPYSLDTSHQGYPPILDVLDRAAHNAGREPDVILSGHVHNYQRFTRVKNGRDVPYLIAGSGGYANTLQAMHRVQKDPATNAYPPLPFTTLDPNYPGVSLLKFDDENGGFMRITVDATTFTMEYFSVPMNGAAAFRSDRFRLDRSTGKITELGP